MCDRSLCRGFFNRKKSFDFHEKEIASSFFFSVLHPSSTPIAILVGIASAFVVVVVVVVEAVGAAVEEAALLFFSSSSSLSFSLSLLLLFLLSSTPLFVFIGRGRRFDLI